MLRLAIAILFSTLLLGACGTRGSLTLPPPAETKSGRHGQTNPTASKY